MDELSLDRAELTEPRKSRRIPVTLAIIAINLVLLMAGWVVSSLKGWMTMDPSFVWRGEVWRIFTYAWAHAGLLHWLGNSIVLLPFGLYVEIRWGRGRMLAAYLAGCLGSGVILLLFRQPAVGASGAVAAILALWLAGVLCYRKKKWYQMLPELALGALVGLFFIARMVLGDITGLWRNDNIAHWGHLGGFATGYLLFRAGALGPGEATAKRDPLGPDLDLDKLSG